VVTKIVPSEELEIEWPLLTVVNNRNELLGTSIVNKATKSQLCVAIWNFDLTQVMYVDCKSGKFCHCHWLY